MARKRANGELARALRAPSFRNPDAGQDVGAKLDPISPTTLVLSVSEIKAYEHNPRLAENLEYPRLKDSIRNRRGLTTPLTVTKRPGDALYTIAAGGNSRLKALKELAEETGDEAFLAITCRFEPWDSECQVFANHLIENDVRGTMTFGDRARAILEWQRLYEESHPDRPPLSQRELVDLLAEAGYRLQRSLITPLLNTAKHLLPHLPVLFGSGLGRPAAEQLVRLRACAERLWNDNAAEQKPESFETVFADVCARQDGHSADFDLALFSGALTAGLAQTLGLERKIVALDLDSAYHGYTVEFTPATPAVGGPDPQGLGSSWVFERSREINEIRRQRARARIGAPSAPDPAVTDGDGDCDGDGQRVETEDGISPPNAAPREDAARLREANYLAARELAAKHALAEYLKPLESGFGFYVEAPEPAAVPPNAEDRPTGPAEGLVLADARSSLWWLLCFLSDQLSREGLAALADAYPASWLVELMTELPRCDPAQDARKFLALLVGEPSPEQWILEILVAPSTDDEAGALEALIRGCRHLRVLTSDGRLDLWGGTR